MHWCASYVVSALIPRNRLSHITVARNTGLEKWNWTLGLCQSRSECIVWTVMLQSLFPVIICTAHVCLPLLFCSLLLWTYTGYPFDANTTHRQSAYAISEHKFLLYPVNHYICFMFHYYDLYCVCLGQIFFIATSLHVMNVIDWWVNDEQY